MAVKLQLFGALVFPAFAGVLSNLLWLRLIFIMIGSSFYYIISFFADDPVQPRRPRLFSSSSLRPADFAFVAPHAAAPGLLLAFDGGDDAHRCLGAELEAFSCFLLGLVCPAYNNSLIKLFIIYNIKMLAVCSGKLMNVDMIDQAATEEEQEDVEVQRAQPSPSGDSEEKEYALAVGLDYASIIELVLTPAFRKIELIIINVSGTYLVELRLLLVSADPVPAICTLPDYIFTTEHDDIKIGVWDEGFGRHFFLFFYYLPFWAGRGSSGVPFASHGSS